MEMLKKFVKDESGLETVEYAVMAALILVGIVAVVALLGEQIKAVFGALTTEITP